MSFKKKNMSDAMDAGKEYRYAASLLMVNLLNNFFYFYIMYNKTIIYVYKILHCLITTN